MDGFKATQLIRENISTQSIPIYAVAANVTGDVEQRCNDLGFNDFIPKPVSRERIKQAIDKN